MEEVVVEKRGREWLKVLAITRSRAVIAIRFRALPQRWLIPVRIPLSPQNGHEGGSGHPPPPRPIRLSSFLRAKVFDYHGPTREEPGVSILPDAALYLWNSVQPQ